MSLNCYKYIFIIPLLFFPSLSYSQPVISGISTAPTSITAGNAGPFQLDPDNGAIQTVLCDQNGTTCLDINNPSDALSGGGFFGAFSAAANLGFDGSNYGRIRSNSAANMTATTQQWQLGVTSPGEWVVTHFPATGNQATASKSAGAAGVRHVARSITACLAGAANATLGNANTLQLRDGASGAGTVVWSSLIMNAANTSNCVFFPDINIIGSAATAMTIEFAAANAASSQATVTLTGYSTQ